MRGIEKSFRDLHVLRGVDLDVTRGSVFALLGSNGAGKTTLVRILATLARADAGSATIEGIDVAAQPRQIRAAISLTGRSPPSTGCSPVARTLPSSRRCAT